MMVKGPQFVQEGRVIDNPKDIHEFPEKEFWRLTERNNNELIDKIRNENKMLKDLLLKT